MAVSNSDTVILPDAAIPLSDFQNASSRLTLVLCPPRTTDRFTIRDFISGLVLNSGFYTSRRRWQRNRINGRRLGTARPFPLWRLHSGPQSWSVDQCPETPPEHLESSVADAMRRSVVTHHRRRIKKIYHSKKREGRGYTGGSFWRCRCARADYLAFVLSHSGQNVNCQLIRVWVVAMKIEIDGTACREA